LITVLNLLLFEPLGSERLFNYMSHQKETSAKLKDHEGFREELKNESDRAVAIVGAAFLDEHLRDVIGYFLIDDKRAIEGLFRVNGVLGSFGGKIEMAYCLGLLSKRDYHDLKVIQKIRNRFAHELHGLSFASEQIVEQCKLFKAPQERFSPESLQGYSPRNLFIFTLAGINSALAAARFQIVAAKKRCTVPIDIYKGWE
jgi:DNA-binding MltR family transcriptional regulator